MFGLFRNYRLNSFLSSARITKHPLHRIDHAYIDNRHHQVFDLKTGQGRDNFTTLISYIYTEKDERTRLKILVLVNYLLSQDETFSELFLQNYQTSFKGNVPTYSTTSISTLRHHPTTSRSKVITTMSTLPSQNCIHEEQQYHSIHNYLYSNVIVPYHSYLIRLANNQAIYWSCKRGLLEEQAEYNGNQCWKLLNTIKELTVVRVPVTHIGRYYKEQAIAILDFVQVVSEDLIVYKTELEKQMQCGFKTYWHLTREELSTLLLQVEEALVENQNMHEVFHNRYYCQTLHSVQPAWFSVSDGSIQIVEAYYRNTFDQPVENDLDSTHFHTSKLSHRTAATIKNC